MTPRLISRPDAAAYCGLTPRGFDDWVKRNIVPGPLPSTKKWDVKAIDAALDKLSGFAPPTVPEPEDDPLEAWKRKRALKT